jgi:tRNA-Thr(GGU) m(6)t(6)A37 methyltransferase TsaA
MIQKEFRVIPIGSVKRNKGRIELHIRPKYRPAMKQLEHFSHIQVLMWADQVDNEEARNWFQTEPPYAPGIMTGIFATRSEARPNPILLTPCKILTVEENSGIIEINNIDAHDDTPIIDIKGYFPVMDRVKDPIIPEWLDRGDSKWVPEEGLMRYEDMGGLEAL